MSPAPKPCEPWLDLALMPPASASPTCSLEVLGSAKSKDMGASRSGHVAWFHLLISLWSWASHLTSLALIFSFVNTNNSIYSALS